MTRHDLIDWRNWRLGKMVKVGGTVCGVAIAIWGYTGTLVTSQVAQATDLAVVSILKRNGMGPDDIQKMQQDIKQLQADVSGIKSKVGEIDGQTDGVKQDIRTVIQNQNSQHELVEKLLNKALGLPLDTPQ